MKPKIQIMKKLIAVAALCLTGLHMANGSGYQVLLQGNRTTGMGNLSVALNQDVSSLFFNPGAMSMIDHNGVMAGLNLIYPNNAFWNSTVESSNYTAQTETPSGTPFHMYAVWGPKESPWKFGLGFVTPFGSSVRWEEGWMGRDLLTDIRLKALQFQPTVSYKITDKLGIGAGLTLGYGSIRLERTLFLNGQEGEGSVALEGDAEFAYGFNIGLFYALSEKIDLGVSYRSELSMKVEGGDADFVVPSSLASAIPAQNKFSAELPLPSTINIGLTYHVNDKLDIGTEFNWVGWSAYDSLIIDFETNTPLLEDSRAPRKYEDSFVIHLGGEYKLSDQWQLRLGGYYDTTPVQDGYMTAETPDNNRIGLTAGVGFSLGERFQFDASFLYIHSGEREQTVQQAMDAGTYNPDTGNRDVLPGTYRLNALIPGLSIAYKF
jgi:long-chain fatty acid transport protein